MGQGPSPLGSERRCPSDSPAPSLARGRHPLYVHVDLDAFFVVVERARRPDLAARPLVIGGRPGGRGRVASASREARRCGVRAGMPLTQAAIRCPDAVFVDGAFDAYFAASLEVDDVLRRASPHVEWLSIDEAVVALHGAAPQQAVAIADGVRAAIQARGFDAAFGVARARLVSRIAAQLARPRGLVHVLDGYEARFLAPLKIEMLPGIDQALARRLRAAGIRRLGQIATLPDAELARLAGRAGTVLGRQAAGVDSARVRPTALPPSRLDDRALTPPSSDTTRLHAAIAAEVDRVGHDLRARGVFARTLTLRVRLAEGRVESRTVALGEPSALDGVLLAAAIELLPRVWRGDRLVRAVGVSCGGVIAASRDGALFATS